MTAIVMAGRTGAAFAARLATMQGNEEVDALLVLGIRPAAHLVLPRVSALMLTMPLLYLYAVAAGLAGGLLASVATLGISPAGFVQQLRAALEPHQFLIGLAKSLAFAALIGIAACGIGLAAGRSAAEVGRATTDAVVAGIVGIIVIDAAFALALSMLGL